MKQTKGNHNIFDKLEEYHTYSINSLKEVENKLETIKNLQNHMSHEIDEIQKSKNKDVNTPYSNIVKIKPKTVEHTYIFIKPESPQDVKITRNEILSNINPTKLKIPIYNIRNTREGIIMSSTVEHLNKLKHEIENIFKTKYIIKFPKKMKPRFKIMNIDKKNTITTISSSPLYHRTNSFMIQTNLISYTVNKCVMVYGLCQ